MGKDYRNIFSKPMLFDELVNNPARRVPICICIDSSYSMRFNDKIKIANEGIADFVANAKGDPYVCDAVDLCVINFSEKAEVNIEFQNVKQIKFKEIRAAGTSSLGGAVELALEQIEKRLESYKKTGIQYYKPWVIIMSDGESNDSVDKAARKLRELQEESVIKAQCINLGKKEGQELLKKFTVSGEVENFDAFKIKSFFNYLSESAKTLSLSNPNDIEFLRTKNLKF